MSRVVNRVKCHRGLHTIVKILADDPRTAQVREVVNIGHPTQHTLWSRYPLDGLDWSGGPTAACPCDQTYAVELTEIARLKPGQTIRAETIAAWVDPLGVSERRAHRGR